MQHFGHSLSFTQAGTGCDRGGKSQQHPRVGHRPCHTAPQHPRVGHRPSKHPPAPSCDLCSLLMSHQAQDKAVRKPWPCCFPSLLAGSPHLVGSSAPVPVLGTPRDGAAWSPPARIPHRIPLGLCPCPSLAPSRASCG